MSLQVALVTKGTEKGPGLVSSVHKRAAAICSSSLLRYTTLINPDVTPFSHLPRSRAPANRYILTGANSTVDKPLHSQPLRRATEPPHIKPTTSTAAAATGQAWSPGATGPSPYPRLASQQATGSTA